MCVLSFFQAICAARAKLEQKGYKITERATIGQVDAILKNESSFYEGGADSRCDDTAFGW